MPSVCLRIVLVCLFSLGAGHALWAQGTSKRLFEYYDQYHKKPKSMTTVRASSPRTPHGTYVAWYQNGNVRIQGEFAENKAAGYWIRFFQNGQPQSSGSYNQGKQVGEWVFFHENGCLKEQGLYTAGVKTGHWKYFYENGVLKATGPEKAGSRDSLWTFYHDDGSRKATCFYTGSRGLYKEYYDNGKVRMVGRTRDGISDSTWRYFYESGHLKAIGNEKNGLKNGPWKFYFDSGSLQSEGEYKDGVATGEWKYYHENGNLASSGPYNGTGQKSGNWNFYAESGQFMGKATLVDGNGPYIETYDNGKVKVKGQLKNGQYDGTWYYYFDDGTLEGRCEYVKGEGEYIGYYRSGRIRLQGHLVNGQKDGAWLIYNTDGSLFGLYKSFKDAEEPLQRNVRVKRDTMRVQTTVDNPTIALPKPKSRLFTKRINEKQGLIFSMAPLHILYSNLPVSMEYYRHQRLGTELGYVIYRRPFFEDNTKAVLNREYTDGYGIYLRQKFFLKKSGAGTIFCGPGIRYMQLNYALDGIIPGDTTRRVQKFRGSQTQFEATGVAGIRYQWPLNKSLHFTTDLFVVLGIGFRNSKVPRVDLVFQTIDKDRVYVPRRLGVSVGILF